MARDGKMANRMSKKMMGITGASIGAFTLLLAFVAVQYPAMDAKAEEQGNVKSAERIELSVIGNATQMIKPDRASISVGVEAQEKTAGEAARKNAEIMNHVIEAIKAIGIREEQISTNYYTIYPLYEPKSKAEVCLAIYPPPPECLEQVLVGYKAVNTIMVNVELDKAQDIGKVIDAAVDAGANQIHGVSFFISQERLNAAKTSLLYKATKDARSKAESVATALNLNVVGVKSMDIMDGYYPGPIYFSTLRTDAAEATTPIIPPSEQSISVSVQIVFWLE